MAQKTKAQLLSDINTLLADNTSGDISAADLRQIEIDLKDSYPNLLDAGVTDAEFAFLQGVTSAIQDQLDEKVTGPASSTNLRVAIFSGTTGKLLAVSPVTIAANGSISGVLGLNMTGNLVISNPTPVIELNDGDASPANENRWQIRMDNDELRFQGINDVGGGGASFVQILRSGASVTELALYQTAVKTLSLAVTGAISGATTLNGRTIADLLSIGGDIGGTGAAPVINDEAITNAKLAHIATNRIKGRSTAGTGDVEDLTAAEVKTMLDLPTNTVTELADKLPLSGGTMTGAINGDQDIRGRRPQGETLTNSTPTYAGEYINQFYQVDGEVDFTLPTAPSGVSAGDVTEFLLISGRLTFAIESGVKLYVTNLGRFTSGEFKCTGAGDAVVLRYLGSDAYQLTGNNISQV